MKFNFTAPIGIAVALAAVAPAEAATVRQFSTAGFEAAQRQGRPILVDVYADWCPVCRAQHEALGRILPRQQFKDLAVFRLDFDSQKDAWRGLGVQRQSTLIMFRGRKEVGRLVAASDPQSIEQLLGTGLR